MAKSKKGKKEELSEEIIEDTPTTEEQALTIEPEEDESLVIDPGPQLSHLAQLLKAEYEYVCDNRSAGDAYEYKHKLIELFPLAASEIFHIGAEKILRKIGDLLPDRDAAWAYACEQEKQNPIDSGKIFFSLKRIFDHGASVDDEIRKLVG